MAQARPAIDAAASPCRRREPNRLKRARRGARAIYGERPRSGGWKRAFYRHCRPARSPAYNGQVARSVGPATPTYLPAREAESGTGDRRATPAFVSGRATR